MPHTKSFFGFRPRQATEPADAVIVYYNQPDQPDPVGQGARGGSPAPTGTWNPGKAAWAKKKEKKAEKKARLAAAGMYVVVSQEERLRAGKPPTGQWQVVKGLTPAPNVAHERRRHRRGPVRRWDKHTPVGGPGGPGVVAEGKNMTGDAGLWAMAAERFASLPYSNGRDKRYEAVKAEIRALYGATAINTDNKLRLKALAIAKGKGGGGEGRGGDPDAEAITAAMVNVTERVPAPPLEAIAAAASTGEIVAAFTRIEASVAAEPPTITISKVALIAAGQTWREAHSGT